jgi:hypothetical protein
MASLAGLQATVLDNFSGPKTGWTDTLNGGSISQAGGQFTVATAHTPGALTYSLKTSSSFEIIAGDTLELRVDVNAVTPGNGDTNALAVLGWVPSGGTLEANGYSFYVGAASAIIMQGASVLYSNNFVADYGTNVQSTNVTLVLRMTPSGSSVILDARLYRQTGAVVQQNYTCIFEETVTNSPGLIGVAGYAALGILNQASPSGASVSFANLQDFVLVNSVLDNFSAPNSLTNWSIIVLPGGAVPSSVIEYPPTNGNPGYVECIAGLTAEGGFAGAYYAGQTFEVVNGSRLEFSIDFDNPGNTELNGGGGSYAALGYFPSPSPDAIFSLIGYHIASDIINTDFIYAGKNYEGWWADYSQVTPPVANARYDLIMTGEGANERIEVRLEDLTQDINSPSRVVFQNVMVDTPGLPASALDGGTIIDDVPYLNDEGAFTMLAFASGPCYEADVIFRNARVSQTFSGGSPPAILSLSPADGTNFVASTNSVSFEVRDAVSIAAANISLTLNGVTYTSTSPGVTVTGTSKDLVFTLAGALATNVNYVGTIQAVDGLELATFAPIRFDTFVNPFIVESEDFNFSTNGVTGGSFIDNPILITDDCITTSPAYNPGFMEPGAYNGQGGIPGVDYHTSNDSSDAPSTQTTQDDNHVFRWTDPVQTAYSTDFVRAEYVKAGGNAAGYFEVDLSDINDGDWQNYTHTYPAGTYAAYLRQEQYLLPQSVVTLERVTSDRTETNQTTTLMGVFLGSPNGSGPHFNVPLTDAVGTPVVVRFSGTIDTLRVHNRVTGNNSDSTGFIEQNYLALVPMSNPGTLRPIVVLVSPTAGQTVSGASPATVADIANRDTTVDASSIVLTINGIAVPSTNTPSAGGVQVTWSISVLPPAAMFTNTLAFKDSDGISQSVSWTYSYPFLPAANSLPIGSLTVAGFDARMVQSSAANIGDSITNSGGLDNSVASAEAVLAIPPQYAVDLTVTNIVQLVAWDLNATLWGAVTNFPGLCIPPANPDSFAVETFAYLQLTAGAHRFYVDDDDTVGIYSGTNLADTSMALMQTTGVTHAPFDFVVEADGLYPFHIIYEQGGGQAYLVLHSVNLNNNTTNLVNAAGGVSAFYPLVCKSSTSVAGPYTADAAANAGNVLTNASVLCDGLSTGAPLNLKVTGGTLTNVPMSGPAKFYLLDGPRPTRITNITKSGSNVVITYLTP